MTNIKKVSVLAGVSTATVSRALKSPSKVAPATRDKVMAAVKKAGYRPNWLATSVKTGKSKSIVVLVPNLVNSFFLRIIGGIEQTAQEKGYSVLLGDTQGDSKRESDYASMVLTNRADGLIQLDHSFPFSENDEELAASIPMVSVGERIDKGETNYPRIELDNFAAGRALAYHLVGFGHRQFGAIVGQVDSQIYRDRLSGFKSVLDEDGIIFDDGMLVGGEYSIESGIKGVQKLLSSETPPTAIFCFNDDIAIGAMHEIHNRGLRIPDDISIVGFDNINVSAFVYPTLTTIDQPAYDMGRKAMEVLYSMLHDEPLRRTREIMPFRLLERQSSGPIKT